MTLTDETLSTYLDGELPPEEMDRITDEVAASPVLAARLEAFRLSDKRLAHQFAAADKKPIRADTLDMIKQFGTQEWASTSPSMESDTVVKFKQRTPWAAVIQRASWGQAVAASIALFIGIATGIQLDGNGGTANYATLQTAGLITDESPLYSVLEAVPSLERIDLVSGASATPVMSFESADGGFCRELQVATGNSHSRSVACRSDYGWLVKATVASAGPAPEVTVGFVPASALNSPLIDQTIMGLIKGDALNAIDEGQLIKNGWSSN